jgi:FMN phosphatase YigB (HAD superfamily)
LSLYMYVHMQPFTTIIFDIGDVLFTWSSVTKTTISSRTLHQILSSHIWHDYERGLISQQVCYETVGNELSLDPAEIGKAFDQARDSLRCNEDMISFIRELKCQSNGRIRIFAMSNISLPDYNVLRTKPADWSIFDRVFASCTAGQRKPDLSFYRHVIAEANVDPSRTIFVDDKLDNVISARSLGFHGIVFDSSTNVINTLRNLTGDPIQRGQAYLKLHAGKHHSFADNDNVLKENFAQLLLLEMTNDSSLVDLVDHPRTWNFFQGKPLFTTEVFPFDLDTTSLGLLVTNPDETTVYSVIDEILQYYVNPDGIVQTYFDPKRSRFDPVVCVNVLALFYAYGRGAELYGTLQWVHDVLLHRAYLEGTRYYTTPECFLFFLARLLRSSDSTELHQLLGPLLKERTRELIGTNGDALALAMRLLTCAYVGLENQVDLQKLLPMQREDGGWEIGWIYKYGSAKIMIGNRGLTTAMAIKAIEAIKVPQRKQPVRPPPSSAEESHIAKVSSRNRRKRSVHFVLPSPSLRDTFHEFVIYPATMFVLLLLLLSSLLSNANIDPFY